MFILLEYADGSPIIVAGPCWPFCMFVTVPLILGISGLVTYFLVLNKDSGLVSFLLPISLTYFSCRGSLFWRPSVSLVQPTWIMYIYFPCVAFVLLALFCVSCRNPGLMERVTDEEAGEGGWFWNEQVGSFRPPGALYCRECGVSQGECLIGYWMVLLMHSFGQSTQWTKTFFFFMVKVLIQEYDHLQVPFGFPWIARFSSLLNAANLLTLISCATDVPGLEQE